MMFNVAKWFTGLTIMQLKETFVGMEELDEPKDCTAYEDRLYYDCSARDLNAFPPKKQLNSKMQILNISSNPITVLYKDELKSYTDLRELVMFDLHEIHFVDPEFLAPVQKLEILNMNYTKLSTPVIKLPTSIKILYAADVSSKYSKAIDLDLSELINLENISLAENEIQGFPILNQKAPIVYINLKGNPITNIEYINLAPFCKLECFVLEKYSPGQQYAEKCCGVLLWLEKYEVHNELNCGNVDGKKCGFNTDIQFSDEAIEIHNECVGSSPFSWLLIVNIVVGLVLMLAFAYMAFRYYRSSAVKAHRRSEKVIEESELDADEEHAMDMESIVNFHHPLS